MAQKFCQLIWRKFACSRSELRLDITLKCGQSFRWKAEQIEDETIYAGVLFNKLVLLKQDESFLHYSDPSGCLDETALQTYLNLDVDLQTLYQAWSKVDPIFLEIGKKYPGVRMLRQDPVENLFSFICSANNNISRISGMVENMAKEYGDKVCEFEGVEYHSFPKLESLSVPGVEDKLRELGFGYRAKYIQLSAQKILELGGEEWLHGLRKLKYSEAKEKLLSLSGIGPKVADCILLMSLDQPSSVPVDTHVFQIAKQYLPHLNTVKSVTNKVYTEIGDHFRGLYGDYAGWAHSVLFSADLRHLQALKLQGEPVEDLSGTKKSSKITKAEKKSTNTKKKTQLVKQEKTARMKKTEKEIIGVKRKGFPLKIGKSKKMK